MTILDINDLHSRLVRNLFLNIELLLNDGIEELSEYDVQNLIYLYLARVTVNTELRSAREKINRTDCVIFKEEKPLVFYEIKTYFKESENFSTKLNRDIQKLRDRKTSYPTAKCYLIIAGERNKLEDVKEKFKYIEDHVNKDSRKWFQMENYSARLRPSRKDIRGRSFVSSWEIKEEQI